MAVPLLTGRFLWVCLQNLNLQKGVLDMLRIKAVLIFLLLLALFSVESLFAQRKTSVTVIASEAPAQVYINNRMIGLATPRYQFQLTPGSYELRVVKPGKPEFRRQITVGSRPMTLNINLNAPPQPIPQPAPQPAPQPQKHQLSVGGNVSGADLYIDGRHAGVLPFNQLLPPGRYQLRVTAEGFEEWNSSINLSGNQNLFAELAELRKPEPPPAASMPDPDFRAGGVDRFTKTIYMDEDNWEFIHKVRTSLDGTLLVHLSTTENLNLDNERGFQLFDADGKTLLHSAHHSSGLNKTWEITSLRAGEYTLRLQKDRRYWYEGTLQVGVELMPHSIQSDSEPNDSFQASTRISDGAFVSGNLGYRGQGSQVDMEDWYQITLARPGEINLEVTASGTGKETIRPGDGELNLYGAVAIFDASGVNNVYFGYQTPGTRQSHKSRNLTPGTYYIQLKKDGRIMYWGSYTMKVAVTGSGSMLSDTPPAGSSVAGGNSSAGSAGSSNSANPGMPARLATLNGGTSIGFQLSPKGSGREHGYAAISISRQYNHRIVVSREDYQGDFSIRLYRDSGFSNEIDPLQGRVKDDLHPAGGKIWFRDYTLSPGTYYLKVTNNRDTAYKVGTTFFEYNTAWDSER